MKITIERQELITTANNIKLMPLTDEGWIYVAQMFIKRVMEIDLNWDIADFKVRYKADGRIKDVTVS